MKSGFLLLACWLAAFSLVAQSFDARIAQSKKPFSEIERLVMPPLNNEALRAAEMARRGPGIAPRFAENIAVQVNPQTHGSWETLPNGREVWRLGILSKGALSLNLGFNTFRMPEGGTLILYSPDRKKVMGPFTPADNEDHDQLWTPVLDGDELIIEVQVPAEKRSELALMLTSINHDFMGFSQMAASGSCNLDVVCGAANGWGIVDRYRDIIRSVAIYGFNGNTFCTGFLINNTRNDCTPYFMTANHCGVNANNVSSLVVYWNYENSVCRQPLTPQSGGNGNGTLDDFNSGAILRANYSPSDMTLVELDDPISSTANAFFAGWSIAETTPQDSVICVHHPSTDEKRISFEFDPTYRGSWGNGAGEVPTGNHLIVPDWDIGTTEGGSSGAPLFDRNKRVVGQLHGGAASCGNDSYDSYGWFTTSWTGGGANNNRLRNWLDPDNTGVTFFDGRNQTACSFFVEPDLVQQEICAPEAAVFTFAISPNFADDVTLSIQGLPANLNATFDVNPAPPGGSSVLTLSNTNAVAPGTYPLNITATDGTNSFTSQIQLTLANGVPTAPVLISPANNETGVSPTSSIAWTTLAGNISYEVQLATDALFTQIVVQTTLSNVATLPVALDAESIYFWRVRPSSFCGVGEWSAVFTFETAAIVCAAPVVSTEQVMISPSGESTITSTIEIEMAGDIASIRLLGLNITHSWVGDLSASLTAPDGTTIQLFDQPGTSGGGSGCSANNILVNLYDSAPNSAAVLENTCGTNPAIGGDFEPINSFAAFVGTPAAGTWTLTVSDAVDEDGGMLNGWSLEICTVPLNEAVIYIEETDYRICQDSTLNLEFTLGTGFSDAEVTLAATDLPPGATAVFTPNPAEPGAVVTAVISGLTQPGDYTPGITADGGETALAALTLTVQGAPEAAGLVAPANGATDVLLTPTLSWSPAAGAVAYQISVASDPDFMDMVWTMVVLETTADINNLDFNNTYYWRVDAIGLCGATASVARNFTTEPDLTFLVNPATQEACLADDVTFDIEVGAGFNTPAALTYSLLPAATLNLTFNIDPANVPPGAAIEATAANVAGLNPGTLYTLTFTLTDGTHNREVAVQLLALESPALPTLIAPANGASLTTAAPAFSWQVAAAASAYYIEIATDELFQNLIVSQQVGGTSYTPVGLQNGGLYFWRVTALNGCGGSTVAPFTFTYAPNDVDDVETEDPVIIAPNPTKGLVSVQFPESWNGALALEVYAANGQRLQRQLLDQAPLRLQVDLSPYPSGVYWLHLVRGERTFSRKVVKE